MKIFISLVFIFSLSAMKGQGIYEPVYYPSLEEDQDYIELEKQAADLLDRIDDYLFSAETCDGKEQKHISEIKEYIFYGHSGELESKFKKKKFKRLIEKYNLNSDSLINFANLTGNIRYQDMIISNIYRATDNNQSEGKIRVDGGISIKIKRNIPDSFYEVNELIKSIKYFNNLDHCNLKDNQKILQLFAYNGSQIIVSASELQCCHFYIHETNKNLLKTAASLSHHNAAVDSILESRKNQITLVEGVGSVTGVEDTIFDVIIMKNSKWQSVDHQSLLNSIKKSMNENSVLHIYLNTTLNNFCKKCPPHLTELELKKLMKDNGFAIKNIKTIQKKMPLDPNKLHTYEKVKP